jgi:hypothetical protein
LIETKKLAENLPERLNKITENLAQNQFQLKIDAIDEERFTDAFQKVANRISIALIIAALIIGSSLLMRVPNFQIFGISIAMFFFIIASVFGLWLAYKMVMKDEDFKRKIITIKTSRKIKFSAVIKNDCGFFCYQIINRNFKDKSKKFQ